MIITKIKLEDFGIYGGMWEFNLTPTPKDGFNRPIVLFKGKNGAGKTTLTEAIRLCLHGSLALGSRISRAGYEKHLVERLHRPPNTDQSATSAKILLWFDYVDAGRKKTYQIERAWTYNRDRINETIEILENGDPLAEIKTNQQKENFLRELISPRVTHIFFFDGERLEALADDEVAADLVKDTMETLFGLNLVSQLQKDLDVYLTRQSVDGDARQLQHQLKALNEKQDSLQQQLADLKAKKHANQMEMERLTEQLNGQKQRIASEGGWFAEQLDETETKRQQLMVEIEILRKQAQEMANGLLPFAVAPQMNHLVAQRLKLEQEYEQAVSAYQVVTQKFEQISDELTQPTYWADLDLALDDETQHKLLTKLETTIKQTAQPPDIDPDEIMLRFSDQDRQTLRSWIDRAADEIPRRFCQTIHRLNALEDDLKHVSHEMELVPSDETLQPLVETLHQYSRELGVLEKTDTDLSEQAESLTYQITQVGYQLERVRQQLDDQQQHNQRVHLAIESQKVLGEYLTRLRHEKVKLLEKALGRRFNQLCRKEDLISGVIIDPESFALTLLRRGQTFERKQLSAGEKQLLATATVWALREVSNAPMPVILDTPLGRLDSDHRQSMLDYFAQASHQVILLATDTEIDDDLEAQLEPVISRGYNLDDHRYTLPQKGEAQEVYRLNGREYSELGLVNEEEATAYETE